MVVEEISLRIPPLVLLQYLAGLPRLAYVEGIAGPGGRHFTALGFSPRACLEVPQDPTACRSDLSHNPLQALHGFLGALPRPDSAAPFPLRDAAIGYLAYDLRTAIESVPSRGRDDVGLPLAVLGWYDPLLVHDGATGRYYLASSTSAGAVRERRGEIFQRLATPQTSQPGTQDLPAASTLRSDVSPAEYRHAIARIHDYIAAGDVYQINFTQRFTARLLADPLRLFARLAHGHPMPLSAYFDAGGFQILSNSPELFLERRGRRIATQPIKGTRPRGRTPDEDVRLRRDLLVSTKDRAEHVMIVDLERNDLGRICRPGSVRVPDFARVETYPTLHHLVSTVVGDLEGDVASTDVLRATFPGGSITGAPKIRAMEIIDALEPHARGIYTGALGMIDGAGDMHLNLLIRTAVSAGGLIHYGAGGGIVADSDPDAEYAESLLKAHAIFGLMDNRSERAA